MGRFRHLVIAFVLLGLVVPLDDAQAQVRDAESDCNGRATFVMKGVNDDGIVIDPVLDDDDDETVAEYQLLAEWCVERVFETSRDETVSQNNASDGAFSEQSDDPTQLKRKKGKKGRKGKKARRNRRPRNDGTDDGRDDGMTPRAPRTQRRLVSTCITSLTLTETSRGQADLIGDVSKQEVSGNSCASRTFHVEGRFGLDYVQGTLLSDERRLITTTEPVSGVAIENFLFGRLGYFNFTVQFNHDGRASCISEGCRTPFEFCDARVVVDDDDNGDGDGCVRL